MERELIMNDFFLESTRTYLEKIFNINYKNLVDKNFDEYVLKALFLQRIPILKSILFNNKIEKMDQLLIPLTKQKYEVTQEKFQDLLNELSKASIEDEIVFNSAKLKFIKFRILSEIQLAIFDFKNLEKESKYRKTVENKIYRDIESLIFHIRIIIDGADASFEDFFKNFICCMPDIFLIEEMLNDIFKNLEFDSDLISLFTNKCKENKEKNSENLSNLQSSTSSENKETIHLIGKKRNFKFLQENSLDPKGNKHESLESNPLFSIKEKKSKTIDNYFTKTDKELGFRNVKEKIEGLNKYKNEKLNKNISSEATSSSSNNFNRNSFILNCPITPTSLSSALNMPLSINTNNFYSKEALDNDMNNVTLPNEDFENNESRSDYEKENNKMKEDEKISDNNKETEMMSDFNLNSNTNKILSTNSLVNSNINLHFNRLNNINLLSSKFFSSDKKQNFSEFNSKIESNNYNAITSNQRSTNFSNLSAFNTNLKSNNLDISAFNNQNNNSFISTNNHARSNSNIVVHRGINSRLANIQNLPKTKKEKKTNSIRKKNTNEKIIEKFFDRIQSKLKEDTIDKKKESHKLYKDKERINTADLKLNDINSSNLDGSLITKNNPLKKIIHRQFYAREKDLKSPSPIQIACPKYSKKKVVSNPNENIDIKQNSNISTVSQMDEISNLRLLTESNTNSNHSTLEGRFTALKNIKHNKSNTSSNMKKSPDISTGLSYNSVIENNNIIILNKIKNKAINSNHDEHCSDDEILAYATPTKSDKNLKFGKKSPNSIVSSKVNLMNLFNQFKHQKK